MPAGFSLSLSIIRTCEGFSISEFLHWKKKQFLFPYVEFLRNFVTETFDLNLCSFNIAENAIIAGIAF